jgi:hypothetical protein
MPPSHTKARIITSGSPTSTVKRLIEHIWKVVGIASACSHMGELERKAEELYGKRPGLQFALKLVDPSSKVH